MHYDITVYVNTTELSAVLTIYVTTMKGLVLVPVI